MTLLTGWTTANRVSLAAFAASALLCGTQALAARRAVVLPEAGRPVAPPPMPRVERRAPAEGEGAVLAAVARDPFRPDRRRPPGRYRMPGEAVQAPSTSALTQMTQTPVASSARLFRVLGTVTLPDGGGLAALAAPTGESRVVRVGQSIAGFRLTRVGAGTATLVGEDTTLVLRTPGTGGTP